MPRYERNQNNDHLGFPNIPQILTRSHYSQQKRDTQTRVRRKDNNLKVWFVKGLISLIHFSSLFFFLKSKEERKREF
jgi:hypothetical protein